MANAVGNAAKQFAPEAGMTTVAENDETETTGRYFGNECLRSVATAIAGLHRNALLGSRDINTFPEDGLEELPCPFFVFPGFPCPLAAGDRIFLDPEQMRFRADVLCQRERVSERCVRGVRAVVGDKCFAITRGLLYGTHDENTAWRMFVDAIGRVANEFSPTSGNGRGYQVQSSPCRALAQTLGFAAPDDQSASPAES